LFYGDLLHPTSAGSAIIARYIAAQLQAPRTLQGPSRLALDTAEQFGRTLSSRMDFSSEKERGLKYFIVGDALSVDAKGNASTDAIDIDSVGATAGVAYLFGSGVAGIAVNYSRPRAGFAGDASDIRSDTLQVGGFANVELGGAVVQGYVGYGRDDHEINRSGVVEGMHASTDGSHWLAGAKVGYLLPMGDVRVGPVATVDYARAKVDGFSEDGDPALTLDVSSVRASTLVGSLGVELQGDLEVGGLAFRPMLELVAEKSLGGNAGSIRFAQTSAPVIVNRWEFDEQSKKAYGRMTAGFGAALFQRVSIDAQISTTFGRNDENENSAQVGLRFGF
jgi:outer membrane autotransporter protein